MSALEAGIDLPRRWLRRCRIPRELDELVSSAEEVPGPDVGIPQREVEEICARVRRSFLQHELRSYEVIQKTRAAL